MDEKQFEERVLACERRLYRISFLMLRSQSDCEDAVQEAIYRAWKSKENLHEPRYFETWLIRILINECHRMRKNIRYMIQGDATDRISTPQSPEPDLYNALSALDAKYRMPVILMYVEGYSTREISSILRIPQGTVSWRIHRAMDLLRNALGVET